MAHNKNRRSFSASIADGAAYFLKFQYLTNAFAWMRRSRDTSPPTAPSTDLYQNYLTTTDQEKSVKKRLLSKSERNNNRDRGKSQLNASESETLEERNRYMKFLENTIFGSPDIVENLEYLVVKRDNKGLVPKLLSSETRRHPEDILRHNLEKVVFYEQNQACSTRDDIFVSTYLTNCFSFELYMISQLTSSHDSYILF